MSVEHRDAPLTWKPVGEVAALVRELRTLTGLGSDANPAEREAFVVAKRELIARIEAAGR